MYRNHTIGVVVPAYNEAAFVGDVLETLPEFVDRIYAVDDASTDGTWDVIERRARETQRAVVGHTESDDRTARRVVPIRHETNRGVGGAIKTGYQHALDDEMDIVAVVAGDGQMNPDDLPRLLDPIVDGRGDYAKGDRLSDKDCRREMSRWRLFGNGLLTGLTRIASGYWDLSDPQNGYTAISREALSVVDIDSLFEDFGFCNDLLARLNAHDMAVIDIAMPAHYGDEQSHIEYRTFVPQLSLLLARTFIWRLRRKWLGRFDPGMAPGTPGRQDN